MEKKVVIQNESGMHARPAGVFVKKANEFNSDIELEFNGKKINAKSVMAVMSLGIGQGGEIKIIATGDDAEAALNALVKLVQEDMG